MGRRTIVDEVSDLIGRRNGHATAPHEEAQKARPNFAPSIRASALRCSTEGTPWLWHGYLVRGHITLFSALWKCGKSTLLAHLLRTFEIGGSFCGLEVAPASVLYITEESEQKWAERRDALGISDHCRFRVRPFGFKPRFGDWQAFLADLKCELATEPADLLVFDTLSKLWPVRDENNAAEVDEALMPLYQLTNACPCGIALVHHLRKSGGQEGTASRGSGALSAFVDIIAELWRYDPAREEDRRRVLRGYSRWDDTPRELVIELNAEGTAYDAFGNRTEVGRRELAAMIRAVIPSEPPGWTADQIREEWPAEPKPHNQRLRDELAHGSGKGEWRREGEGKKGSPFTYWVPSP